MSTATETQLERLNNDLAENSYHADQMEREGNIRLADKIHRKMEILQSYIDQIS